MMRRGRTMRPAGDPWPDRGRHACCLRCGLPFGGLRAVAEHETTYGPFCSSGIFPLCERCWAELADPWRRLPYYDALLAVWDASAFGELGASRDTLEYWAASRARRREIADAVLAGG